MATSQITVLERVNQNDQSNRFNPFFLHEGEESILTYLNGMKQAQQVLVDQFSTSQKPYSGITYEAFKKSFISRFNEIIPEDSVEMNGLIDDIGKLIIKNSIVVTDPSCIAHLHCPPLSIALAAEVLISGTNQSMDSWDQSSAATVLEETIVNWLSKVFMQSPTADGVFTSGGTQSNFMGLLLARDRFLHTHFNWNAQKDGLPKEANRLRIFCSKDAHFTVRQSAFLLGLGEQAVIPIETDKNHRMDIQELDTRLKEAREHNLLPFALVATAGTTDFGSIDPLVELASRAKEHDMWFHIDAAYGGALMLSEQHKGKLKGIELGDSVTIDFHKLFYQPISCGAFLLKDQTNFKYIKLNADYLNPEDDEEIGIPNLVTKSIQTTRRFDSLKLFMSLQYLGRKKFAEMIDYTMDLAKKTALLMKEDPELQVMNDPEINAVVFRYHSPQDDQEQCNKINTFIRSTLLGNGDAILARTRVNGSVYLKFTLLNPRTTIEDIQTILSEVKKIGKEYKEVRRSK